LRHAASPILSRLDPALKSMQFIEDGAVPPDRLPEYVRGVRAALAAQRIRGVIFGHAGDAHVHVNPLVDVREPDWRARVEALLAEVTALAARLGGTLAGEHGDGRLRTPLMPATWDASARGLFEAVKRAFDPAGVLNPGVKVSLPGQRALGDVKYDPRLPALPPAARRALDHVADGRAYSAYRLELLEREAGHGARDA
jgi:FAD/FMN-containing dehydrogenase